MSELDQPNLRHGYIYEVLGQIRFWMSKVKVKVAVRACSISQTCCYFCYEVLKFKMSNIVCYVKIEGKLKMEWIYFERLRTLKFQRVKISRFTVTRLFKTKGDNHLFNQGSAEVHAHGYCVLSL